MGLCDPSFEAGEFMIQSATCDWIVENSLPVLCASVVNRVLKEADVSGTKILEKEDVGQSK